MMNRSGRGGVAKGAKGKLRGTYQNGTGNYRGFFKIRQRAALKSELRYAEEKSG